MLFGLLWLMSRLMSMVLRFRFLSLILRGAAADARAALSGATTDTAVVAADARPALADAAADVTAAVDSAGDLYRRACCVRRHCSLHVPCPARRFWL